VTSVEAEPLDIALEHGEGPVWDARSRRLYFVDLEAGLVGMVGAGGSGPGAVRQFAIGRPVGIAVPHVDGGLVLGVREGVAVRPPSGDIRLTHDPLRPQPGLRMNDGAVDPAGRFFVGSMRCDGTGMEGTLYCVDLDGTLRAEVAGIGISNGLAWDRSGARVYYVDSAVRTIYRADYDTVSGHFGDLRPFKVFGAAQEPDGLCLDADGNVWVALWDGWRVECYSPAGKLIGSITLPVSRPTSCVFGGEQLQTLFITTSRLGFDGARLAAEPLAGRIFAADLPGVRGAARPACAVTFGESA
jgi:sugar lactone lactonase YvrE